MRAWLKEDASEMIAIGKDLILAEAGTRRLSRQGKYRAGRFCGGDFLRPQVLLHRERVVGSALDGRVVGDDHALDAVESDRCR